MKKVLFFLMTLMALSLSWGGAVKAQDLADYTFSTGQDQNQWITLSSSATQLVESGEDDDASTLTDIGFSFPFGNGVYTQFWANSNGVVSFNSTPKGDACYNQFNSSNFTTCQPKICGITKDMSTGNNGYVKYELTGTAPNRVLVCEFMLGTSYSTSSAATVNFQVQLYESDSKVVLVYGSSASPSSFQIGLSQSSGDIWTVNPSTHETTHATGSVSTTYSTWPGEYRYYAFERPVISCPKPTGLAAALTPGNGSIATLSWTKGGEETNWVVEYSTASDFTGATQVTSGFITTDAPSISVNLTSLTAETKYYARVKADCGGGDESEWSNVIEFTPTDAYTLPLNEGSSTSSYVPFYYYVGSYSTIASQFIIPAADLASIQWATIDKLTFYNSTATVSYGSANFTVYAGEVNTTTQSGSFTNWNSLTAVYTGTVSVSNNEMVITFDQPFQYTTGNLLIGFKINSTGTSASYSDTWKGVSATSGASVYSSYSSSVSPASFLPQVTISYTPGVAPSCLPPTTPQKVVNTASTNSVQLTWTVGASETAWDIYYTTSSSDIPDENTTPSRVNIPDNPYTLDGLTHSTHYYVYVRANCGDEQSLWSQRGEFATACDAVTTFPWRENFESYTANTTTSYDEAYKVNDPCWLNEHYLDGTGSNGTMTLFQVCSYTQTDNSTNKLQLPDMKLGTQTLLRLPEMTLPNNNYQFTIDVLRNTSGSNYPAEGVRVYASTDGEIEGATELGFLYRNCNQTDGNIVLDEGSTGWYTYEFPIPFSGTCYIILRGESTYGSATYMDNLVVEQVPTCRRPSALMLETPSSRTAHTATLKWTNGEEGQNAWQIAYSTDADFDPSTVTPVDVTTNPATIEGLAQSTTYYAYVRANCGTDGYSDWSVANATFTTLAGNVTPTGLAVADNTITSTQATASWNAVAGNTLHQSYDIYWAEATVTAVPEEPAAPNFISGITATSQPLSDLSPETEYKVWVRDNCGSDGYSAWSSAVTFTTASACQTPDGLAANSVTNNSATLSWNAYGQTGFNLQYRVSGEEWDANNIISNVNTPYSMNPILTGNTTYQVRVQATCTADPTSDDSWSNVASFTTACDAEPFPWSENFDTWTSKSVCWSFRSGQYNMGQGTPTTYSSAWTLNSSYGSDITIDGKALTMNLYSTNKYWAVTPAIDITTDDAVLKVDVAVAAWSSADPNYDNNDTLAFAISTDGGATFTNLRVLDGDDLNDLGNDYTTIYVPVAGYNGQAVRFAIYGGSINNVSSSNDNRCVIDNVRVEEAPSCYPVGTLSYDETSVTPFEVDLSWTLVDNGQNQWKIEIATNEGFEGYSVTNSFNTQTTLAGLTPETHYWVRVKAICGNDYGEASNVIDFTTGIACQKPTNLAYSDVDQTSALLSWTENGNANNWVVAYKADGDADFTEVNNVTNPYYLGSATALVQGTNYTVKVRANCGGYDGMSQWSDEITFMTVASCPAPENLAVTQYSETAHGATITWEGNNENDSYTIEYAVGPMAGVATLLEENFDDSSLPTGWNASTTNWSVSNSDNAGGDANEMHLYYSPQTTTGTRLVTPAIDLTGIAEVTFSLKHDLHYWSSASEPVTLGIATSSNGGTTWNEGWSQSYSTSTSSTISEVISTSDMGNTNVQFCIFFSGDSYNIDDWYFDDITITTEFTPTYTWNTLQSGVTGNSYTINTLDPETQYVVRVKGDCNGTPSPASNIVGFTTLEACGAPTAFILGDVEAHQASFSWTAGNGNTAWKVYVKKHADAEYPATYTDASTVAVTINELDAAIAYDVKIVPTCNETKILEVENAFTTACEARTAQGYEENFDSYTVASNYTAPDIRVLPTCWKHINTSNYINSNGKFPTVYYYEFTNYANTTPNCLKFYSQYNSDPQDQYAILPEMNGLAGMRITLYARRFNSNSSNFKVGLMSDPTDVSSFVEIVNNDNPSLTSNYQQYTFDVPTNATEHYVAIMMEASTTITVGVCIDDISIEVAPTCYKPTAATVDNESITTSGATISWTPDTRNADGGSYSILDADDNEVINNITIDQNNHTATLTGLTENTPYTFKVATNCANTAEHVDALTVNFTTLANCQAVTNLEYSDLTATGVTLSWTDPNGDGNTYIIKNGDNVLDGTTTPAVTVNGTTAAITGLTGSTNYTFTVVAHCSTADATGVDITVRTLQEPVTTYPYSNGFETTDDQGWEVVSGTTNSWVIGTGTYNSGDQSLYVSKDGTSYAYNNSGIQMTYVYRTFQMEAGGVYNIEFDWKTSSGDNDYDYMRAWLTPASAVFTANQLPDGTTNSNYYASSTSPEGWTDLGGGRMQNHSSWTSASKEIIIENAGQYNIVFMWAQDNSYGSGTPAAIDNLVVTHKTCFEVSNLQANNETTDGATLTWEPNSHNSDNVTYTVFNVTNNEVYATSVTGTSINVTGLNDGTSYEFTVTTNCGTNDNSDAVSVNFTTLEACGTPTAFTLGDVEAHQASFSWTAGNNNTAWKVYVKKHVDADYPDTYTNANAAAATINELDDNTTYDVKIVPTCDDTKSLEVANAFTTKCNPFVVHRNQSFTENFDATTFPPTSCWNTIPSGTYDWSRDGTSGKNHSGSIYGSAYSYYYGDVYLVLPDIALTDDATDVKLTFWSYNTYVGSYGKNSVVLLDGDNETELWSPTSVSQSWKCDTVNLSAYKGQTISLAFKYEGSNAHGWYLDDIAVAFDPCYPVTNLSYDNESLTANTVALSWTPGAETNWRLQYRENGTQDWNTVDVAETDLINGVYTLDQLNAGATYEWQVAAACTNTFISDYTAGANFTTLENCPAPTNLTLTTDSETPNGATITWTAGSTANEHFTVEYRVVNEESWIEIPSYIEETTYTFTTLEPATTYQARVRAVCGTYLSDYSNVVEFTTEANPGFTVTFVAGNSGTCNTTELTGITVELPAATPLEECANNGWTFAGWTTTELTENTTTAPAPLYEAGTNYTPSASVSLYAVYMRTEGEATAASYNLVTEAPNDWSGDYLIAYTTNNVIFNSSQDNLDANNAIDVNQYWDGNTIASNETTDAVKVTITATGNGNYSLLAANGKYFGNTSTSNALVSRTSPAINNTISLDASGNAVIESNSTYLRMNTGSGSGRFRYYGSGQQPIQLYRYTSATPVTYAGAPDCSVPVSYNIIVTQVQGATIMAPSTAAAGNEVQLIIVPEDGYALNEWQVTTSTAPVTVTNNSFVMPAANVNVTATLFNVYTVAATAVPANGGTVNGAGSCSNSYNENTEVTLTAAANTGYDFTGWYNDDDQVSENNSYTFTVTGNVTLEARFAPRHTVTFNAGNGSCTTTSLEGSTIDLSNVVALPAGLCANQGWTFAGWSETSVDETTTAPTLVNTSYSPASDIELFAVYSKTEQGAGNDTWTMASSIAVGDVVVMAYEGTVKKELTGVSGNIGTATDYTTLPAGTYPLTVEQGYADNSYAFKNNSNYLAYTGNGNNLYTQVAKDSKSSWTVTSVSDGFDIKNVNYNSRYLQYNTGSPRFACYTGTQKPVQFYKLIPGDVTTYNSNPNCINSYVITAEANDATYGTVTGTVGEDAFVSGAEYAENTVITLTAIANTGYSFVNWTKGGETVSYNPTCTLTVTEAAAYVANFAVNSYNITVNINPSAGGTVTGAQAYDYGTTAMLTATANTGYHFVNWTKDDVQVSTDAEYSFTVTEDATYVANFELNNYDITVSANPTEGGTVSGAGNFNYGDNVVLTATANTGYHFVSWTKGGASVSINPTCTLAVTEAAAYVANFELNSYDITVSADPTEGGNVSGAGNYNHGADVTLTATANEGYTFVNWTKGGESVSTNPTCTLAVTGAAAYVAHFSLNSYAVTATVNPAEGGTVTGAGTYSHGANVTLTATANNGYHFVNWTENDAEVSTDASYSFTFTSARNLVANFAITPAELAWSAESFTGYTLIDFNNWKPTLTNSHNVSVRFGCVEGNVPTQGGVEVDATTGMIGGETGAGYIVHTPGTYHIYAVHDTDPTYYYDSVVYTLNVERGVIVALLKNIDEAGTAVFADYTTEPTLTHSYSGLVAIVAHGQTVRVQADPATGYHFNSWQVGDNVNGYTPVSTEATYTYTVPDIMSIGIKAVFDTNTYALNVVSANETMGIAAGSTTAKHFLNYEISATPNTGYHFTQWSDGNTQNPRTVTLTENTTYTAEFAINNYTVAASANPTNGGSIEGAGNYNHFANATLTATATTGYTFVNWTEGGQEVSTNATYSFQVTGERELVANFSLNSYAVSTSAYPAAGGTVTGAGTYNHGASVTVTATANEGYTFVNWTEGEQVVSTEASYTFTFTGARTLVANFTPIIYTVTFNAGTGTCQTQSLTGSIESSINIDAVTAVPSTICGNQDWVFAGWSTEPISSTTVEPITMLSGTAYYPMSDTTLYAVYTKTVNGEPTSSTASIDFSEQGYTNGQAVTSASIGNNVNVTFSQGTNNNNNAPKYYSNGSAIRCYGGNTFTVMATEATITNITLTLGSGNSITANSDTYNSNGTWTGNENSVTFTIDGTSGNRPIAGISVTTSVPTTSAIYNSNPVCYVYAVNVDQNIEHGSVTASQTTDIVAGTEITLTPAMDDGYHFGRWFVTAGNDPVTVENNKFTMPESDVNVSAEFWIDTLTVEVNANPTVGGTVSGAGDYEYGNTVTLEATAATGYTFVNWTEAGVAVSDNATYAFTFDGEAGTRNFVANFSLNSYEISVSANPTAGGNVNGGNTYNHGATAMLTANPSTGYHFVNWTKEGVVVSTDANYSFTVAEAGAYVANFELNSYTIAATANPTAGGTVTGAGIYNHFANVTLTATVNDGYDFDGWYNGNNRVATSLEYSFEATGDVTLEARFAKRYTITFVPGSHSSSTIEPRQGSSVTAVNIDAVTADPSALCVAQDWEFAGWSSEAIIAETTVAPTTWVSGTEYYPTNDIILYAVYTKTEGAGSSTSSITFSDLYNANTVVDGTSISINDNTNTTVVFAQENGNYAPQYYANGTSVRCYPKNTMTISSSQAITNIVFTFGSSDGSNTISVDEGNYSAGTWTGNENSVTFTIGGTSGNRRIAGMSVTTFSGTVTYNSDPECFVYDVVVNPDIEHGTVTADPNTGVIAGTEITLTNTPSEGYHFAGWTVTAGNDPVTVENNKFLMPESDVNVTATFEPDTFTLTINYSIVGGGDAPQSYSDRLPFGTPYSVNTPVIAGLTPSQEVVSGTMPAQDVTVNVTYSTVPYTLTIHYVYADNTPAANDVVRNLAYNVPYSETSPTIEGYTPDQAVVSGTMGEADLEVTVVYSINSHNLTVNYVNEASAQVAESHTATLNYHDNYSVFSPQVAGYAANKSVVSGTMGDADKTETVTYYLVETSIVDATNCAGTGTGSLTVTAPTGNFEYSLDGVTFQTETQFANLNAGDYTLYIRPTGEAYNYSGVWTVNSNITMPVAEASVNPFYCLGDEINLSGNGSSTGSEYTYAWSGPNNFTATDINATIAAAEDIHSGSYTLTVTNTVTNCVSDTTVDVIVNTPNMNGYLFTIATHGDAYANLVGGQATPVFATPTVQHYLADAGCTVTLSNDAQATYEEAGDYTITWTATDACGNTATTTQVLHIVLGTCPVAADVDGNTYPVVALNNICWMAANLRTTHYSDGRLIPNPMVYTSVMYPDATANLDMFGYLYDWTAAMDAANGLVQDANGNVQGICPDGWRMPKENEIRALVNDGVSDIFDLRTTDQWLNNFGTNTTGFSLLPAGCYNANSDRFENLHGDAYIWGVGASAPAQPRVFWADCKCYNWQILDTTTPMGYSVRCVRNN